MNSMLATGGCYRAEAVYPLTVVMQTGPDAGRHRVQPRGQDAR